MTKRIAVAALALSLAACGGVEDVKGIECTCADASGRRMDLRFDGETTPAGATAACSRAVAPGPCSCVYCWGYVSTVGNEASK